jgi:hypothetical protein
MSIFSKQKEGINQGIYCKICMRKDGHNMTAQQEKYLQ